MKKLLFHASVATLAIVLATGLCIADEHPGATVEHPGKAVENHKAEHPGKPVTAAFVKKSIKSHVKAQSKAANGVFIIHDEKLGKDWNLKLEKIHDPVRRFEKEGKTIYFTCCDFKATEGKDILDVDFWMVKKGDKLEVIDTKIHKLNGAPRYSYEGTEIKEVK
ncbi:MAG: hypothetical protein WA140_07395 [Geobacteraceae bacterium]